MPYEFQISPLALVIDEEPLVIAQGTTEELDVADFLDGDFQRGPLGALAIFMIVSGPGQLDCTANTTGQKVVESATFVPQPTKVFEGRAAGTYHTGFTVPLSTGLRLDLTENGTGEATVEEMWLVVQ